MGRYAERCKICGTRSDADLFSAVTGEDVCSLCKLSYIGGLPTTPDRIQGARELLMLKEGEFLQVNRGERVRGMLGRG